MHFFSSFKKYFFVIIIVSLTVMSAFAAKGDANKDSQVNIVDALVIAQYSVGSSVSIDVSAADVNCDSSVNIIDALLVAQYSVGLSTGFPCQVTATPTATATQTATPTPPVTTSKIFPYAPYKYQYGLSPVSSNQSSDNSFVQSEWQSFKSKYITSNGAGGALRLQRPQNSNDTVSEGIGYGMLLAVYMDDQTTLNGLWAYAKKYFNANGLMNWQIDAGGTIIGKNAATDGDEDMALALVFADKKWGGYRNDATTIINNIYRTEVEAGTNVLKPGDMWGGSDCTNISYYSPAAYKIFASYTGNNSWNQVVDKCYQVISAARNSNTGLVPDWCTASGGSTSSVTWDQYKDAYYYDAVRAPLRLSWDYIWFGDSRASENCNKMTAFWAGQGATNIMAGYTLSGSPIGNYKDGGFYGVTGACAIASNNRTFATSMLDQVKSVKSNEYFQDCLRMISLLVVTGNFPNINAL